ncbi:hypothetical protein MKW92_029959 [Papaver armeniacum]|nr:hypothetical protein MKW92_029959 [Papaver armeniacum]
MNSSSYSSIADRYEGRLIMRMDEAALRIHERLSKCRKEETIDQKIEEQQHRIDLEEDEAVPYVIVVQGPPKVGKSLLIKSLVKFFAKECPDDARGLITLVSGKHRRLQFVECPNDVTGMIDAAKYADLVLLCIDASYYCFEMETFEFFNLLQVHGSPNVIGVLSHLDETNEDRLTQTKQRFIRQFRNEIYDKAELFYLSGLDNDSGMYMPDQIVELAKFISEMKFNPLSWQTAHPYVLVDLQIDDKCDRNIVMYGYLRGSNLKIGTKVHIAGVGDFPLYGITSIADPCSLPSSAKVKGVGDKERLFYAPMSGLGDLLYELNDPDEVKRLEIEGFRAGTYLKLEVRDVPFASTENIDPYRLILVGGISLEEENVGCMQARLKQHRWHLKLLKTREPIIVSVGWRRYQTRLVYAQEDNGLHLIDHIPKYADCLAMFWGPLAPQDSGVVAVKNLAGNKAPFRVSAMGVILESQQVAEIVKKPKQVGSLGTPPKIFKKTSLIKDMFTSDHEIEGAAIQTARGVRGNAKKAAKKKLGRKHLKVVSELLKRKGDQPREETASGSLQQEDKVFMREWEKMGEPEDSSYCIGPAMELVSELDVSFFKDEPELSQQPIEQERRTVLFTETKVRCGKFPIDSKEYKVRTTQCEELSEEEEELSKEEESIGTYGEITR